MAVVRADDLAASYAVMLRRLKNADVEMRLLLMRLPDPKDRNRLIDAHHTSIALVARHAVVLRLARIIEDPGIFREQITAGDWIVRRIPKKARP